MKKKLTLIKILFFVVLLTTSCDESVEPVELVDHSIPKDSELFELIKTILYSGDEPVYNTVCIDFVYPIKIFKYNSSFLSVGSTIISSDNQFINFLENLDPSLNIGISYPIQTTLPDGSIFSINNDQQLLIALKSCSREDIINYCNGAFGNPQGTCVWEIPYISGGNNEFAGAVFTADITGTIYLHHHNTTYYGTWIFLYVNDELHLNINLSGISNVAQSWNHNYKIVSHTDELFVLQTSNLSRRLEKYCSNTTLYSIGETGPRGGIIAYDKGEFSNGWQYIEVAENDLNIEEWGCVNAEILAAQYTQIGTGHQNTIGITNYHDSLINYYLNPTICSDLNNGSLSAKTALNHTFNSENDWFIPSFDELETIYNNLSPLNIGNFEDAYYWSSSEYNISNAKCINFENGNANTILKNNQTVKTRLIRYF